MPKRVISLLISSCLAMPLAAEVVVIPVGQQAAEMQSLERPRRGISQEKVREQFGEPLSISGPVGDPPISSWQYENFSVYFEHNLVLHSVLRQQAQGNATETENQ